MGSRLEWYEFLEQSENEDKYGYCICAYDFWDSSENDQRIKKGPNEKILF